MRKGFVVIFAIMFGLSVSAFGQTDSIFEQGSVFERASERNRNEAVVREMIAGFEARDLEPIAENLAESAVLVQPMTLSGLADDEAMTRYEGKQAILGFLQGVLASLSNYRLTDVQITSSRDRKSVFVQWKGDSIVTATGRPYKNVYIAKYEFDRGKVVRIDEYFNPIALAKAFDIEIDGH